MTDDRVGFFTDIEADPTGSEQVTLVEGSSFCISERDGDLGRGSAQGLFVRDVRILTQWLLTVDGRPLRHLAVHHEAPFACSFLGQPTRSMGSDSPLLVIRRRFVADGLGEDLVLRNDAFRPVTCTVKLSVGADLAGVFDVKGGRTAGPAMAARTVDDGEVCVDAASGTVGVRVRSDAGGATDGGFAWRVTVPARGTWAVSLTVVMVADGATLPVGHRPGEPVENSEPSRRLHEWHSQAPIVDTASRELDLLLRRSVEDLGALRIHDPQHPERPVVAAGAPWFMALFGRDSLLTSWMLLPIDTSLAVGTLQTLAERQGRRVDPVAEEEPGRILHEVRFGGGTPFGSSGVYYGTADATALFVMLVAELRRWRGAGPETDALLPAVDRALAWLVSHTETGSGYVTYERSTPDGLVNQGWKDSWDGINFADGRLARAPIALAEVQAYTYAAYLSRAHWAEELQDDAAATLWHARADRLRTAFNRDFWLPARGWFAVGLDGNGVPIDALTSNIGHCLWAGIVDDDKAAPVAAHLVSDDMFSGWGIRTLAVSMAAYNPLSYHNGSVWPHDTAICIDGLMRYGFTREAQRVASGLLDAAQHVGHRLPELFAGFPRAAFPAPVPYPTSCSPQAWASASPLLILRAMLGIDPDVPCGRVRLASAVRGPLLPLQIRNLRLGGHVCTLSVGAAGGDISWPDGAAPLYVERL